MEQNYNFNIDGRVAFLKNLVAPSGGFVVMDTGVIAMLDFSELIKSKTLHGSELKETLFAECILLERIHNLFKENSFVFPQEVREEYRLMTNSLEDYGRYTGENGWYIPLIRARRRLFNDLPCVQDILNSSILNYMTNIENIVIDISREFHESNPAIKYARKAKGGLPTHAFNDERILAKSFALSYASPTRVISSDKDFIHIYEEMVLNADKFIQRGTPSLPDNPLELVFIGKTGNTELFDFGRVRRRRTYRDK